MNILPKKSWHVRNKNNIERVRRDEEKAAEEEKECQRRIALAEQEARTEVLRHRSRKRQHDQIEAPATATADAIEAGSEGDRKLVRSSAEISLNQGGHINFFKDIEQGLRREGKNKEHEAEKAAEKEKWEKNIGLLTYLGQSAIESQNDKPWYLQKSEPPKLEKASPYEPKKSQKEERDRRLKDSMDPLQDMKRHLEKRHKHRHKEKSGHHSHSKPSKHNRQPSSSSIKPSSSSSSSSTPSQPKKAKTVEELRAERLRRETAEKQKIAAVMARARGESSAPPAEEFVSDADRDRARGYNSRYNPAFVKPVSHHRK